MMITVRRNWLFVSAGRRWSTTRLSEIWHLLPVWCCHMGQLALRLREAGHLHQSIRLSIVDQKDDFQILTENKLFKQVDFYSSSHIQSKLQMFQFYNWLVGQPWFQVLNSIFVFYYKSLQSVSIGLWKPITDPFYKKDQKLFLWHVFVFLKNSRVFESESGFDCWMLTRWTLEQLHKPGYRCCICIILFSCQPQAHQEIP